MSAGEIVLNLLISICFTAFLYMLVPLILILRGKQYPTKMLKKIAIINGVIVWFIFRIIQVEQGIESTGAAVFLWAWVGYRLLAQNLSLDVRAKSKEERFYMGITAISIMVIAACALIILINW